MKIKGKLLAGGLMTAIACGLVGSITGTFAWYQISNQSTLSMHGASVGASQNLELKIGSGAWTTANLTWAQIKEAATFKGSGDENDELLPASNGANTGSAALNATWYTNPTGGTTLPEVAKTGTGENAKYVDGYFVQFTFYARYVEYTSSTPSYPASRIYIDEIASKAITGAPDVSFALRMHVQMGSSTYFIVNPYDSNAVPVTLSSTYTEVASDYDWTSPTATTVGLPNATTPGTLTDLTHAAVVQDFNADGSIDSNDEASKYVDTIADDANGVAITVTFWLEGFAESPAVADDPATTDVDESKAASDWWDAATTIGTQLDFGFQLRGVKQ